MQNWAELVKPRTATVPRGDGFTYQPIWTWLAYPDVQPMLEWTTDEGEPKSEPDQRWNPSFRGFRALVLANPLGGQTRRESEAWRAYNTGGMSEPEYLETIAERVKDWEYRIILDDGSRVDVPAPGSGGDLGTWERFYDLPAALIAWLVQEVRTVHFPKRPTRVGATAGTTDSTPQTESNPATERPTS